VNVVPYQMEVSELTIALHEMHYCILRNVFKALRLTCIL